MGQFEREVREQLGENVVNFLRDEVRKGNINHQHFSDLARQLHPHLYGPHMNRLHEKKRVCDEAELREILSVTC